MPIYPPGQDGLTGEIARLRQQVAELSRAKPRNPVCVVMLAGDAGIPNGQDAFLAGGLSTVTDRDGMFHSDANHSWVQIPVVGRYDVQLHVSWADNSNGVRACKILKNGWTIVPGSGTPTNVISSDLCNAPPPGEGAVLHATCDTETYAVGDKIYFSVFQASGGTLSILANNFSGRTAFIVRYLGPS